MGLDMRGPSGESGGGGGVGGGMLSFEDEDSRPTAGVGIAPHLLIELLEAELRGAPGAALELSRSQLLVPARPAEHARIEAQLARLRAPRAGMVELEVQLFAMPPAVFRGLSAGSGLDDAAEATLTAALRRGEVRALGSQRLVAHDGQ